MNNQQNVFFFEIQEIPKNSLIFDEFKKQTIFFSYFQVDQKYYLFIYSQKYIDIDLIDPFINIIEELNTKQRKIRSLRGFFIYAIEIMENAKDYEILQTNLKPSFWRKIKTSLRQNKKAVLLESLFGSEQQSDIEEKIQILQNQVDSLQQKIIQLEKNQTLNFKKGLSQLLKHSQAFQIDQQGDSTLKPNKDVYLLENNTNIQQVETPILKDVLAAYKSPLTSLSESQQSNEKDLKGNFRTLGKISEQERVEIIERGFQLNQEGKISLKKYYEITQEYSLFQFKGYSVKYESIRRSKFYQKLKA